MQGLHVGLGSGWHITPDCVLGFALTIKNAIAPKMQFAPKIEIHAKKHTVIPSGVCGATDLLFVFSNLSPG
jgi:hypothetical protein